MKWALTVLLAAFLITPHAEASDWRSRECRYQSLQHATWTPREERLTLRCAVAKWSVPGGVSKAQAVGDCESGWWRLAVSPSGSYRGLFQHAITYWHGRVHQYRPAGWQLAPSWANSRTQIVVTARMAHARGWRAWSCG